MSCEAGCARNLGGHKNIMGGGARSPEVLGSFECPLPIQTLQCEGWG